MSQIDTIVLIDGGGSNGNGLSPNGGTLGRYANQLPIIVEQMAESFAAVTGIDMKGRGRLNQSSGRRLNIDRTEAIRPIHDPLHQDVHPDALSNCPIFSH